jgi:hypothetical protein
MLSEWIHGLREAARIRLPPNCQGTRVVGPGCGGVLSQRKGETMKRLTCRISLALTTLALLGLTHPGPVGAQQAPANQVPFKFPLVATAEAFPLPFVPPILSANLSGTGEAAPLGQYTFAAHQFVRLGVHGEPVACTDGIGVLSGSNGDAIYITYSGLHHPTADPKVTGDEFTFIVTGGSGRFAGASGNGTLIGEVRIGGGPGGKDIQSLVADGTVSAPK